MKLSDLEKRRRPGKEGVEREVEPLPDGGGRIRIALDKKEMDFLDHVAERVDFRGHDRRSRVAKDLFLDVIASDRQYIGISDSFGNDVTGWLIKEAPKSAIGDKLRKLEVSYTLNSAELKFLVGFAEKAQVPPAEYARVCILVLMYAMKKKDRSDAQSSPATSESDSPVTSRPLGTEPKRSRDRR